MIPPDKAQLIGEGAKMPYVVFYASDDIHEEWDLPDPALAFMTEQADGSHKIKVTHGMRP